MLNLEKRHLSVAPIDYYSKSTIRTRKINIFSRTRDLKNSNRIAKISVAVSRLKRSRNRINSRQIFPFVFPFSIRLNFSGKLFYMHNIIQYNRTYSFLFFFIFVLLFRFNIRRFFSFFQRNDIETICIPPENYFFSFLYNDRPGGKKTANKSSLQNETNGKCNVYRLLNTACAERRRR